MDSRHKMKLTFYTTLIATLLILFSSVTQVGPFSAMRKAAVSDSSDEHHKYVIIFDGGSTGTRIHVFAFLNASDGLLTLEDEYFQEVKPGLSSYADAPHKAANSIVKLLNKAKLLIPSNKWFETPVALKATAGLRLLPAHVTESILEEISHLFKNSPFLYTDDSVSVMDGEDEGLFAWFTLNFLLGHLVEPNKSVAALDLGGGSTQVTFAPSELNTIVFSPKEYIIRRKVHEKSLTIYSHSYLGLGLMSARLSILESSTVAKPEEIASKDLRSPCIHPTTNTIWKHGTVDFHVMGLKSGKYGFKYCYEKAVYFLNDTVDKPEELWRREVYGLSYYFDVALELGLIGNNGGIVMVGEYMTAAEKACSQKPAGKPFLCLDASYISALLHHGLGFDMNKEIMLTKKINDVETSWGLGAAFSMLR